MNQSEPDVAFVNASGFYHCGRLAEAEGLCRSILEVQPRHVDSIHLLGLIFLQQGKMLDAERRISRATEISPHVATFHFNRGKAFQGLERFEEAIASYDRTIALKPDLAEAFNNRANVFTSLKRYDEALVSYDRAIALKPDRAHVFNNRGNVLVCLRRFDEACASYSRAIVLRPDFLDAILNRAWALFERKRYSEGFSDCNRALAISPGDPRAIRIAVAAQLLICDWRALERQKHRIDSAVKAGACVVHPGDHRSFSDSEEEHLRIAQNWMKSEALPVANPLWRGELHSQVKIRLAYLSGDFRVHATAHLIAGVLEQHDKSRFEVIALSNHPGDDSEIRKRIVSACDRCTNIQHMTDRQVALLMRAMEIDIAVDLNGLAGDNRTGILAARPAPIQVNYLGYPGTMGAPFMDYIIADHVVIPADPRRQPDSLSREGCLPA
jgi:protein O-GlcNAc transferase